MGAYPDLDLSLSPNPPRVLWQDPKEVELKTKVLEDTGLPQCRLSNGQVLKNSHPTVNSYADKQKKASQQVDTRFNDRFQTLASPRLLSCQPPSCRSQKVLWDSVSSLGVRRLRKSQRILPQGRYVHPRYTISVWKIPVP